MKTIYGDLIELALDGKFDVIIHGCNCFCTMGAGIAKQIKQTFPEAYDIDCETIKENRDKLGKISSADIKRGDKKIIVVNAYTQYDFRGRGINADYDAIRSCMKIIKREFSGFTIGYPLIGAGLARGNWKIISKIINEELEGENHTLIKWVRN